MQLKTEVYARRTFYVTAVVVTPENIHAVAAWANGKVLEERGKKFVKVEVKRALHERQTRAYVGDYVLQAGNGFRVYTKAAFDKSFEVAQITPVVEVIEEPAPTTKVTAKPKPPKRKTAVAAALEDAQLSKEFTDAILASLATE